MYICWHCGHEFEEPVIVHDDPSPNGVSLPQGTYQYQECPNCGSEDIDKAKVCPMCGDWFFSPEGLCPDCGGKFSEMLRIMQQETGLSDEVFEQAIMDHFEW